MRKDAIIKMSLTVLFLLLNDGLNVQGVSVHVDEKTGFETGTFVNTSLVNDTVVLSPKQALSTCWTKVSDDIPSNRSDAAWAHDSIHGVFVLFGGQTDGETSTNGTWTFNASKNAWSCLNPSSSPKPRSGTVMAHDPINDAIVLFGGVSHIGSSDDYLNDTWMYDDVNDSWIDMAPEDAPSMRHDHAMVFDSARGVFVLFGGRGPSTEYLNDTWSYEAKNNSWTNAKPVISPPARDGHAMTFDETSGEIILFGGAAENGYLNDTWTYDAARNEWVNRTTRTAPKAAFRSVMARDLDDGMTVLFGGLTFQSNTFLALNETWTYDRTKNEWTEKHPTLSPGPRYLSAIAHDPQSGGILMYGGQNASFSHGDVWAYHVQNNTWIKMEPEEPPLNRISSEMVFLNAVNATMLFGGFGDGYTYKDDTQVFSLANGTWTEQNPKNVPFRRWKHALTHDSKNGALILFGGTNGSWTMGDTWVYDGSSRDWAFKPNAVRPGDRERHAMAFDANAGVVILFGGSCRGTYLNDTWSYDVQKNAWTNLSPSLSPPARSDHDIVFDGASGEVILFGGHDGKRYLGDTWAYNRSNNAWTNLTPPDSPLPRADLAMAHDAGHGVTILHGGRDATSSHLGDTWIYRSGLNDWTLLETPPGLTGRSGHGMAYDDLDQVMVLFGGLDSSGYRGDTWVLEIEIRQGVGQFISSPLDTNGTAFFGRLSWTAETPPGSALSFQLRSARTSEELPSMDFVGPDGMSTTFYASSGLSISDVHDGGRWVQYVANYKAERPSVTAVLSSVRIDYNLRHDLVILSPRGNESLSGSLNITWSALDQDNDHLSFDVYLEDDAGSSLLSGNLSNETRIYPWETSTVPDGRYRVRVVASDSNPSIPLAVEAVSLYFFINNSGPLNHPPEVSLVSPRNGTTINTTSVQLEWNGSDMDGDPIVYSVIYFTRPPPEGTVVTVPTDTNHLNLTGLIDNVTYFWTVDAWDGKRNCTANAVEIWSFTVRLPLPPLNHPPRITSASSKEIRVGEELGHIVTAIDEDGDDLSFSIRQSTCNVSLSSTTGRMYWIPKLSDIGNWTVNIRVSDGKGGIDEQAFTIIVFNGPSHPERPTCSIVSPMNGSAVKGRLSVRGTAAAGLAPLTVVEIRIDGGSWMAAVGLENWSFTNGGKELRNGKHRIEARAFDGTNFSEPASVEIVFRNPEPRTTIEGLSWILALMITIASLCLVLYLVLKRHRMKIR